VKPCLGLGKVNRRCSPAVAEHQLGYQQDESRGPEQRVADNEGAGHDNFKNLQMMGVANPRCDGVPTAALIVPLSQHRGAAEEYPEAASLILSASAFPEQPTCRLHFRVPTSLAIIVRKIGDPG
jgi:hypothetical protein